ncbi:RNA pseudouridine synthase [Cyanobium sp. CH-040]|nr:RNA pseudouridine synthase [Cyanobium sp. CH-040]
MPAGLNGGHTYRDRVGPEAAGEAVTTLLAARYRHSDAAVWRQRLAAGEIRRNGQQLRADVVLAAGDRLSWHRPPWHEPAVPALPGPLFDDGDLVAFDKPSGLPVLPAGGFLEHTLLRQIERHVAAGDLDGSAGLPRPVHRLGRFTSGLLLCARRPATRAWLSALLRESTATAGATADCDPTSPCSPSGTSSAGCRKTYRALLQPPAPGSPLLALAPGAGLELTTPIGRCPHARLGTIWAAAPPATSDRDPRDGPALPARSALTLLERRPQGWLVEVTIATGRPHQIRIHTAAAGAPLLGDPLYGPDGGARAQALPGDGGYRLHAHRLRLPRPAGDGLELEAPLPDELRH